MLNHEAIAGEIKLLARLHERLDNREIILRHLASMPDLLARLPETLRGRYAGWCNDPNQYTYGPEAFYQARILLLLGDLKDTAYDVSHVEATLCARHVLKPRAFSDTPRIATTEGVSFVIFPAPAVFWLYEVAKLSGGRIDDKAAHTAVDRFLRYHLAAAAFHEAATPLTDYALDYFIDSLVTLAADPLPDGLPPSPDGGEVPILQSVENFVVAHELAHQVLGHRGEGGREDEVAADRLALEMLYAAGLKNGHRIRSVAWAPELSPLVGIIVLRMWSVIRLCAKLRVLPWVSSDRQRVEQELAAGCREIEDQARRIAEVPLIAELRVPGAIREIVDSFGRVVKRINEHELSVNSTHRIVLAAKEVARFNFESENIPSGWSIP